VSATQVNLQVPYEVTLGANKVVVLTYGSGSSTVNVTIGANDPGLFTSNGSGVGTVAAINEHTVLGNILYSLNAAATPAYAGDVVELYLTGEGSWVSALAIPEQTGFIVPLTLIPLPQDTPYPAVTIAALPATVLSAAPVYGCIMGILQMNITVPAVLTNGAVPIVVTFGNLPNTSATQANATLFVHP
jgi:uncharacterized protein (TIGR03437 family)